MIKKKKSSEKLQQYLKYLGAIAGLVIIANIVYTKGNKIGNHNNIENDVPENKEKVNEDTLNFNKNTTISKIERKAKKLINKNKLKEKKEKNKNILENISYEEEENSFEDNYKKENISNNASYIEDEVNYEYSFEEEKDSIDDYEDTVEGNYKDDFSDETLENDGKNSLNKMENYDKVHIKENIKEAKDNTSAYDNKKNKVRKVHKDIEIEKSFLTEKDKAFDVRVNNNLMDKILSIKKQDSNDNKAEKIKGNINSRGEKIYHVPGGKSYNVTKGEHFFDTEEEAVKKGFRPSKR